MVSVEALKQLLGTPRKIVITTHHKPDGDAMGASLAMYNYLLQAGHQVKVITPTDYPIFLHWLPGNADVVDFSSEQNQRKATEMVAKAEIIFCLDFNRLDRINEMGELVKQSAAKKILIDHHLDPEDFDDFRHWNSLACATCELVYEFICMLGHKNRINKDIATCLYTGIMTDSGSFRFSSTTAHVHRVVADLIECGAENSKIHEHIFDTFSEMRLRFLGYCLKDKLQVFPEYRASLISLSKTELESYGIKTGDTEGIVNYALSINGIKLAALIIERKDKVKLSFRSKDDFPANEIASRYFEGGGHKNAAGGNSSVSLEETVSRFLNILPEYKELLNQ